jgi:hypothetical protein
VLVFSASIIRFSSDPGLPRLPANRPKLLAYP